MKRPFYIWLLFSLCAAVLLAVTAYTSVTVVKLNRENTQSLHRAELEESIRLAMWRLDSAAAPLIARETARPYFEYSAYYPAERAYTRMFEHVAKGEILIPSPLVLETPELIQYYFQFGPDGNLTSPQETAVRSRNGRTKNRGKVPDTQNISSAETQIPVSFTRSDLVSALPGIDRKNSPKQSDTQVLITRAEETEIQDTNSNALIKVQSERNVMEQQARQQTVQQMSLGNTMMNNASPLYSSSNIREGLMKGIWISGSLVLARRVRVHSDEYIQGCIVKWKKLKNMLRNRIRDILPEAELRPLINGASGHNSTVMASLPIRLVPGRAPFRADLSAVPLFTTLILAWACVLLAVAAVGFLLYGVHSLSERRAAFVSAVTHELRTPLTTFRMYAEMLAEGMVSSPEKRKQYLEDLCSESDRLTHLVENVLAYARLEKNSRGFNREDIAVGDLIRRTKPILLKRVEQEGLELECTVHGDIETAAVKADIRCVEQILFNLVDNACKYGASEKHPVIRITARWKNGHVTIRVCDSGPGISSADASKLFIPFSKSAQEAAVTKPGVGLGLALSRRLARQMGGDLTLEEPSEDGSCFSLTIPVV